jgi:hypothetical protein
MAVSMELAIPLLDYVAMLTTVPYVTTVSAL